MTTEYWRPLHRGLSDSAKRFRASMLVPGDVHLMLVSEDSAGNEEGRTVCDGLTGWVTGVLDEVTCRRCLHLVDKYDIEALDGER